jgi:phage anti-repressor protein
MKIYVETPVKVEKGDFLVVDDVQEKGCHCGTRKYVIQLTTAKPLDDVKEEEVIQQTSCYL